MEPKGEPDVTPTPAPAGKVSGRVALAAAAVALLQQANRQVRIRAPFLEPAIFNGSAFIDALSRFATRHPRQQVCILVEDAERSVRENGRLAQTAHRLSDRVQLRALDEQDRGSLELILVVDRNGYLAVEDIGLLDGVSAIPDAHEAAKLADRFDGAWHRGEAFALKTLGL